MAKKSKAANSLAVDYDAEYRAKHDMETLAEAERIRTDPDRMKGVEKCYADLKAAMGKAGD